jgi:hypothetical protein
LIRLDDTFKLPDAIDVKAAKSSCCSGEQTISISFTMMMPGFYPGWGKGNGLNQNLQNFRMIRINMNKFLTQIVLLIAFCKFINSVNSGSHRRRPPLNAYRPLTNGLEIA